MDKLNQLVNLIKELGSGRVFLNIDINYGMGDVVIKETLDGYEFYIIDRATIFNRSQFNDIDDMIISLGHLLSENHEEFEQFLNLVDKNSRTLKRCSYFFKSVKNACKM